jgi:hypothetical protein
MKFTVMEITKQYHTIENTDHKLTLKEIWNILNPF